jgi:hypothetical protein
LFLGVFKKIMSALKEMFFLVFFHDFDALILKTNLKKNHFDAFSSEKNLHHDIKHALNIKNKDLALGLVFLNQYIVLLERKRLNREILFEKKKSFA